MNTYRYDTPEEGAKSVKALSTEAETAVEEPRTSSPSSNIQTVDTVFFWVSDLVRTTRWFQETLGIKAGKRHNQWQILELGGPTRLALHGGGTEVSQPNAVVALSVTDLHKAHLDLEAKGVQKLGGITDTGVARYLTIRDPDGNQVQLIERYA